MSKKRKIVGIITTLVMVPSMAFAQGPAKPQMRVHLSSWTGTATNISGNSFTLTAANGGTYTVDASVAKTYRRFGAIMQVGDIQPGDSVVVRGTADSNNIKAEYIRDTSLQARSGVFSGKITVLNGSSFTLQTYGRGQETVNTDSATVFKKNGQPAQLSDLAVGSQVRVAGVWDRANNNISAKYVNLVIRIARININGTLAGINGSTLTFNGSNGTTYTVDASKARIVNKSGIKISLGDLNSGDNLRIYGRHETGSTNVTAVLIRDLTK